MALKDIIAPYNEYARHLVEQYESRSFEEIHDAILEYLPMENGTVLDLGSGSGRDAAWFAEKGHQVIAVEPATNLRQEAIKLHPNPKIRWLDDSLPSLKKVFRSGQTFDLIWISAVWMHLTPKERERALRKLVALLTPGGKIMITLRTGPVPKNRIMYQGSGYELERLGRRRGLNIIYKSNRPDSLGRDDISWETLLFQLPDDGTGALPLLRHIILHDDKSSTYKLALLRVLLRIADSANGMARDIDDDTVCVPLGLVALYWIRSYKPLVENNIPQKPRDKSGKGLGFVKQGFHGLRDISSFNLRIGARFQGQHASDLFNALKDARDTISKMPAHFITYASTNDQVFVCEKKPIRKVSEYLVNNDFLEQFGWMKIPRNIWQAMGRYAAWIEPAITSEWIDLMRRYDTTGSLEHQQLTDYLRWLDPIHDTNEARSRIAQLQINGAPVYCIWTGKLLKEKYAVDHCFPFSAWPCNDLWNLLPSKPNINAQKSNKLPTTEKLFDAQERIIDWWERGWISYKNEQFYSEAMSTLPLASYEDDDLPSQSSIFESMLIQRNILKHDQQLDEWN